MGNSETQPKGHTVFHGNRLVGNFLVIIALLERRSFFYRFVSVSSSVFLMLTRVVLAWIADHRFRISRSHFCENLASATAVFFTSPEIK